MTTQPITKPAAGSQAAATVAGQAGPSARDGVLRPAHGLRARFGGIGRRERWGYGVWLFVGLVFGVLESWAGITSPPWSALSDTVGYDELVTVLENQGVEKFAVSWNELLETIKSEMSAATGNR